MEEGSDSAAAEAETTSEKESKCVNKTTSWFGTRGKRRHIDFSDERVPSSKLTDSATQFAG